MGFWNKTAVLLIAAIIWWSAYTYVFPLWAEFLHSAYPQRLVYESQGNQMKRK